MPLQRAGQPLQVSTLVACIPSCLLLHEKAGGFLLHIGDDTDYGEEIIEAYYEGLEELLKVEPFTIKNLRESKNTEAQNVAYLMQDTALTVQCVRPAEEKCLPGDPRAIYCKFHPTLNLLDHEKAPVT